jgi:hypothetical protein
LDFWVAWWRQPQFFCTLGGKFPVRLCLSAMSALSFGLASPAARLSNFSVIEVPGKQLHWAPVMQAKTFEN